jgi:hypothetical protein
MVELLLGISVIFCMILLISTCVLFGLYSDASGELVELRQTIRKAKLEKLAKNTDMNNVDKIIEVIKILEDEE